MRLNRRRVLVSLAGPAGALLAACGTYAAEGQPQGMPEVAGARAGTAQPPPSAALPVPPGAAGYKQARPLSCEAAALHTALLLLGMDVPEMAILATEPRSADPDLGFRGNVDANQDLDNYGIHAKGLLKTLEALHTGSAVPRSVQGRLLRSLDEAKAALAQRQPVIVWIPLELLAAQRHDVPLPGGKVIHIVDHEHTVTLNGYDGDRFHALDPFDGSTPTYDAAALTQRMQLFDDPLLAIAKTGG